MKSSGDLSNSHFIDFRLNPTWSGSCSASSPGDVTETWVRLGPVRPEAGPGLGPGRSAARLCRPRACAPQHSERPRPRWPLVSPGQFAVRGVWGSAAVRPLCVRPSRAPSGRLRTAAVFQPAPPRPGLWHASCWRRGLAEAHVFTAGNGSLENEKLPSRWLTSRAAATGSHCPVVQETSPQNALTPL